MAASTAAAAASERKAMQEWSAFPLYLSAAVWAKLQDVTNSSLACLECILQHLWTLGLRAPSEFTKAMLVAILLMREPTKKQSLQHDAAALRQNFLNMKSRMDSMMSRCRASMPDACPAGEYVARLPANPMESSEGLRRAAFGPDGIPVAPLFDHEEMEQLARRVPLRSTNRSAQEMAVATMPTGSQMNMAMAALSAFGMAVGGFQRAGSGLGSREVQLLPPRDSGSGLAALLNRASADGSRAHQASSSAAPLALTNGPAEMVPAGDVEAPGGEAGEAMEKQGSKEAVDSELPAESPVRKEGPKAGAPSKGVEPPASLRESISKLEQMRDDVLKRPAKKSHAVPMKRPACKEAPMEVKAKAKSSAKAKPKAKAKAKQVAKSMKKKDAAGNYLAEKQKQKYDHFLQWVPKAMLLERKEGCGKCRWAMWCTRSCWLMRGFHSIDPM